MAEIDSPIPLCEIETVLAWVDGFKLSRSTKKINRDFSDAVLLAEILSHHYPKLVEMHNYPPRNSTSLKLNNWMTLNRKVLKKLHLRLCCNTMEQLANASPGVIERVLVMVRDKIRRDEDMNRSLRDAEQNVSSGGSYYEACGDEEHVLVVPLKTRINGVLGTVQQKVVAYDAYCILKEELKDINETNELLKHKVEHLDNLLKVKEERIDELKSQLERKQARRKEGISLEGLTLTNNLAVPFENPPSPHPVNEIINPPTKVPSVKEIEINLIEEPLRTTSFTIVNKTENRKSEESKIPIPIDSSRINSKPSITEVFKTVSDPKVNVIQSDEFKDLEKEKSEVFEDVDDFNDTVQVLTTIEETIQKEIKDINKLSTSQQEFGDTLRC